MNDQGYELFVGIDWGSQKHQVCVLGKDGDVRVERSIDHSGQSINELTEQLVGLVAGRGERIAVAIELKRGALIDGLIDRGIHAYAINPKQLDRFRDRHTVAGAKDDRRDAFVLAHSLRTDLACFRRVVVDPPLLIQLREWSRIDDELREELGRLSNQLREQLHRYYPQILAMSAGADEPWVWALLEKAPTPEHGARLGEGAIRSVLRVHRIRRLTSGEIAAQLRTQPLPLARGALEAATDHVALLIPRLRLLRDQRDRAGTQLEKLLSALAEPADDEKREHRDVTILRSLPGVGKRVSATMLAEAYEPLSTRNYHSLRGVGGIAPVTRQSGKSKYVSMRYGCNFRLRDALFNAARVAAQIDDNFRTLYQSLRARGHTHARALRGLSDRMLRVLIAMLRTGTMYSNELAAAGVKR